VKISVTKDLRAQRTEGLSRVDVLMRQARAARAINDDVHAAKLAEARLVLSPGNVQPTPLLEHEAAERRIRLVELAEEVVARAASQAAIVAVMESQRQRAQERIRAATSPAEIDAAVAEVEGL